ncbi:DUF29 family protein [Rhodopila sp.]|uniref:DUF29 family protein n=1 Tax=Rhodopila sp. TaxID=2480087 RepID=UPI003D0AB9E3
MLHGWPNLAARRHWRSEIVTFQIDAARHFSPSMPQRLDLARLYARAVQQSEPLRHGGKSAANRPSTCPITPDELLQAPCSALEAAFSAKEQH